MKRPNYGMTGYDYDGDFITVVKYTKVKKGKYKHQMRALRVRAWVYLCLALHQDPKFRPHIVK